MQGDNGSWNSSTEESAYGVLVLYGARRLSMISTLASLLCLAIKPGVRYLQASAVSTSQPSNGHITSPSIFIERLYTFL